MRNGVHQTLVDIARDKAARLPEKVAYTNLKDNGDEQRRITYGQLDEACRRIGATLQARNAAGERVLLLLPQGVEFVVGFFGTLYGGAIAVPAHTPKPNKRSWGTFEAIVEDCRPLLVLTCRAIRDKIASWSESYPQIRSLEMVCIEDLEATVSAGEWNAAPMKGTDIAFLQYTSGSTSAPKGVMVTHENLMHNAGLTARHMGHDENAVIVSWLPLFHDLGLIGIVIQTLYVGASCYMMGPAAFSGNPALWLRAISRYRATTSMSSDFGYRLCVKSIRPEQLEGVDLSSWRNALNAAEPIYASTLRSFQERFAPYGFAQDAFFPAYGLAEATLLSTTSRVGEKPVFARANKASLARGDFVPGDGADTETVELVSSGRPADDMDVAIVDPETLEVCHDGRIGEVWVRGTSIAQGYWDRAETSGQTFCQAPYGSGEPHYLRTGDLGFVQNKELFVAGRLKDLIITRGRNIYPQDIELTVKDCDPAFRTVNGAAFPIDTEDGESTVIVHEVERTARNTADFHALAAVVRNAVWQEHDIRLADVVFILPASLPKTTSGKVQRRLTKSLYLAGELSPLKSRPKPAPASTPTADDVASRVMACLAALAGPPVANAGPDEGFGALGLDSVIAAQLATLLNKELGLELEPTVFWQYPTPARLAGHIVGTTRQADASRGHLAAAVPAKKPATVEATTLSRDVAIVGIACRLPGAETKEAFWVNQTAARNCIREVPRHRWDPDALYGDPHLDNARTDVRWGGFIDGEDRFSPEFFGISAYEAALIDPQHRLFMKATWKAIWDAGHDPASLAGRPVGVFAGVQFQDYQKLVGDRGLLSAQLCTGNAHAMLANRISFLLDLHGPSEVMDTACSSSLVAIHRAVTALRQGECELAVAGGVNLLLTPDFFIMGRQLGVLSPTGQCRTFDAEADGYVRAEGVGVLFLKPYDAAIRDRDNIHAVIRGSAVNHGGKAASLTAPNSLAQADVMVRALHDSALDADDITYVEMHGTGTELGDPIEVESIKSAFRRMRRGAAPSACALGSVKANIGHLEPAAGVAGVINAVLAMRHGSLPGLSSFRSLNPHIRLEDGLFVQAEAGAWPAKGQGSSRNAMVNSFGFGGANASIVLCRHVDQERIGGGGEEAEVPVAGSTAELLKVYAGALADAVDALGADKGGAPVTVRDIARTLQGRNEGRAARAVIRAENLSALSGALRSLAADGAATGDARVFMADRSGLDDLGEAAREWLAGRSVRWPELADARRCCLPSSPWPDRSCWFEPRQTDAGPGAAAAETTYMVPAWRPEPLGQTRDVSGKCIWIIGRQDEQIASFETVLRGLLPVRATVVTSRLEGGAPEPSLEIWNLAGDEPDIVVVLPAAPDAGDPGDEAEVKLVFDLVRDMMDRAYGRPVDVFHAAASDYGEAPSVDALQALAKSAYLECDWLRVHTVHFGDVDVQDRARLLAAEILSAAHDAPRSIRHAPSRTVRELRRVDAPAASDGQTVWFVDGGVYLLPGGAGELGLRLVEGLLDEVDATFVLAGRSPLAGNLKVRVEALSRKRAGFGSVRYIPCDISDIDKTRALVGHILERHGRLDGILNLVTAHDDGYLFKKSWEEFGKVAASKVRGSINLDLASAGIELDFFAAFSSLAALGLAGGSDYAFGCAFQNAFALWRDRQVREGRRHGASRSISWSRWKWDKYVTRDFDEWFASLGFDFLDARTGIDAFRDAMGRDGPEVFAVHGWIDRIVENLDLSSGLLRGKPPLRDHAASNPHPDGTTAVTPRVERLANAAPPHARRASHFATASSRPLSPDDRTELVPALNSIVCDLLKLDHVDSDTSFASIGLDSVMAIRLIAIIEQKLGTRLTPKALLQHASIARLADHMLSTAQANGHAAAPVRGDLDDVAGELASRLKEMLRADEVAKDARFAHIGVDSIIAMKLAAEFRQQFGVGVSPRWFIDFPTIERMAREIESRRSARSKRPARY